MIAFASSSAFAAGKLVPDTITTSKSGGCGTVPAIAPNDPNHLLSKLGKQYPSAYQGFRDYPIEKSAWANWKPKKKSGFNIQVVWVPPTSSVITNSLKALRSTFNSSGKVKTLQVQQVSSPVDVPGQLQQLRTAVNRKPDLIVLFPLAAAAAAPLVNEAGKSGIPTISMSTGISGKYAVAPASNYYLSIATMAAKAFKQIGSKGNVLFVRGIRGVPVDTVTANAWKKVLTRCPNIKVAGEVTGNYDNTVAKSAVQQFLATHPSGLQAAFHAGSMGQGLLSAFTQTGRTPPVIADQSATEGTLAYWHNHSKFNMVSSLFEQTEMGQVAATVALRVLNGDGVKINTLMTKPVVISKRSQLNAVWKPSFKETSSVGVMPTRKFYFPTSYLNGFFNKN